MILEMFVVKIKSPAVECGATKEILVNERKKNLAR
jgi:hypothetical protein